MTDPDRTPAPVRSSGWIVNQPYLLLTLTALFWAGNAIVGRAAAGHIPPVTLSFLRWTAAFLIVMPFAWKHLVRDWAAIRAGLGMMILISVTGIGAFNTLQYWSLEYTTALNTLLLQSAGPLIVAVWALLLFGIRLRWAQALGAVISASGVLVILLHGDLTTLRNIDFNKGDIIFTVALTIFALYSVLMLKRPNIHSLSFAGLHLRLRRGLSHSAVYLGADDASGDGGERREPVIAGLCRNISLDAGLSVLQSRRAVDRRKPRRAVPQSGAGVWIGDGDLFLGERLQLFHAVGYALVLAGSMWRQGRHGKVTRCLQALRTISRPLCAQPAKLCTTIATETVMKRREFIALLGGMAIAAPRFAIAQTPPKVYRIAVVSPLGTAQPIPIPTRKCLLDALAQLGYVLGNNLIFEGPGGANRPGPACRS